MRRDAREPDFIAGERWVTSLIFQVKNRPGSLYKVMGGFATNSLNVTKLESYQIGETFSQTLFYAEVEGHPEDIAMKRALAELDFFSERTLRLGVFRAHPFREKGGRR